MALDTGSAFATVGARFDDSGFRRWDRAMDQAERRSRDRIEAPLKADVDERGFDRYERRLKQAENDTERSSTKIRGFARVTSSGIASVGVAAGGMALAAGGAFGLVAKASIGAASDLEESTTKSRRLFGDHSKAIERFAQDTARSIGISRNAALEATGTFGNLFSALEIGPGKAAKMSKSLVTLAADLASFNNSSPEEALEAIRSGLVGETEPLRKFGVNMNDATLRAEALRQGLIKNTKEALDPQTKALAAYGLVFQQTGKAQGDFERTSGGFANQLRILKARFSDLTIEIGRKLLPLASDLLTWANKFADEVENNTGQGKQFRDTIGEIGDKLKTVYEIGKDVSGWLRDHAKLVQAAATAWIAYKSAVGLAALAGRGRAMFAAPAAAAATSAAAGGAAATAGGGIAGAARAGAGRVAGAAGGFTGAAAIYAAIDTFQKFGNGPDIGLLQEVVGKFSTAEEGIAKLRKRIDELSAAGDKGGMRKLAGQLRDLAEANADATKGNHLKQFADDLDRLARDGGKATSDLDREVRQSTKNMRDNWRDLRQQSGVELGDIRDTVKSSMTMIRNRLGRDTQEGKDAAVENFRLARKGIRDAMKDGTVSVKEGTQEIRRLMTRELEVYGLSANQAKAYMRSSSGDYRGSDHAGAGAGHAAGGWIGQAGMVGGDSVPAMLAPGEAVLNRHQQAVVEGLLGDGFLDSLFERVNTPHYMAKGGIVPVPGFPGERAASSILDEIQAVTRRFGLTLTDAFGPGHKSPGHTVTGTAADFAGPDAAMDAAVKALARRYTVGYDGRFGSAAWPGHGPSYVAGSNAHLHVEFGGSGSVGGLGAVESSIKAPKLGLKGGLGAIAQGAVNVTAAGAKKLVNGALDASLGVPVGGGGGGAPRNAAQIRGWIAAGLRLAGQRPTPGAIDTLFGRVMQESGGDPNAINLWDSNAAAGDPSVGLLQTIGATFRAFAVKGHGNVRNPVDNVAAAVRYMLSRYGHLVGAGPGGYARGGRVRQNFAGGGRAGGILGSWKPPGERSAFGQAVAGMRPLRAIQKGNRRAVRDYGEVTDSIETLGRDYGLQERKYNLTDEQFLNDDGSLNQGSIDARAGELDELIKIRERIVDKYEKAKRIARRVVKTLSDVLARLQSSVKTAKKKDRAGIREQIRVTKGERADWRDTARIVGLDLRDARQDVRELKAERSNVVGTLAEPPAEPDAGDAGDSGGDSSTPEVTADAQAQIDQANARTAAIAADLATARQNLAAAISPGDLGFGGAPSAWQAMQASIGGIGSGPAGSFGAFVGGGVAGIGGANVTVNVQSFVTPTGAELAALGRGVATALDAQPYRSATQIEVR